MKRGAKHSQHLLNNSVVSYWRRYQWDCLGNFSHIMYYYVMITANANFMRWSSYTGVMFIDLPMTEA
jgi:hypothetical protein